MLAFTPQSIFNAAICLGLSIDPSIAEAQTLSAGLANLSLMSQRSSETRPTKLEAISNATSEQAGGEDIVVTAERRSVRLQDAPLSVSALSGETLKRFGIIDVAGLKSYVSNLQIGQEQGNTKISLRGIGLQGTTSLSDSGVALYIDDFYVSRPTGGNAVFHDIDRIEVLRGPQGTLYGRNATGGVVNVISNRPTDRREGSVGIGLGSRNLLEARGVLNLPIATNVAVRLSAIASREDGYLRNVSGAPGAPALFGSPGDISARGQLLIGTPATVELLVSGTYGRLRSTGLSQQFLERPAAGNAPALVLLRTAPPEDPDPRLTSNDLLGSNDSQTLRVSAQLTKAVGPIEAVLLLGAQRQRTHLLQDLDGSSVDVGILNRDEENRAVSGEFRIGSTASPLSWLAGLYAFEEQTVIDRRIRLKGLVAGAVVSQPDFLLEEMGSSRTIAGFGSITYAIQPALRATAGIRHTDDAKHGSRITRSNFGRPLPPDVPNAEFPGRAGFSRTTWKAGLEYDIAASVLSYASVSSGYKAGGFNISANGSPYDPETIVAYQAGVKSDLFGGRLRVNVDTFLYDYRDLQLTTLTSFNNAPAQLTTNAARSTIKGLELETRTRVTQHLIVTASYAFTDARFGSFFNTDPRNPAPVPSPRDPTGLGRTDLSGNRLPYVSTHTINLSAQHSTTIGSVGTLMLAAHVNWHGELYLREFNDPVIDLVPAATKTDLTASLRIAGTGITVTAYVNNLENDVERNNIFVSPGAVGLNATTAYTRPRTIGLRLESMF